MHEAHKNATLIYLSFIFKMLLIFIQTFFFMSCWALCDWYAAFVTEEKIMHLRSLARDSNERIKEFVIVVAVAVMFLCNAVFLF